jgi:hypothetical protein
MSTGGEASAAAADEEVGTLIDEDTTCRVSSVLNRDTKQFGKKHLFDGEDETCWNSDQVRTSKHTQ